MSVKKHFTSRFEGGSIVEMDYSQLEVIGLAILSDDPQLKKDIRDGLDLHCANTAQLHNMTYEEVMKKYMAGDTYITAARKVVKIFSFQLQYGAGPKTMAESAECSVKEAQAFIDAYYTRYPRVQEWQEETIEKVKAAAISTNTKTFRGYPAAKSKLRSATGREYSFTEQDAPQFMRERGELTSFSPTQIKNYPVQGFSTGDVVPLVLGKIGEYLYKQRIDDKLVMCNTVHDSFIFDVHPECPIEQLRAIRDIMQGIPDTINFLWPYVNFDLPLSVGVEMGPNWADCKPVDIGD